jgi:hypothetical protein
MKAASYRLLRHASAMFVQTEREERRIWSVSEYFSSEGHWRLNAKTCIADSKASL